MKRSLYLFGFVSFFAAQASGGAAAFELKSPDIAAGYRIEDAFIYSSFGCTGQNLSPALEWTDPPAGTKSFAVLLHDPDAPTGGAGFWHWLAIDIPAAVRSLPRGAGAPDGSKLPAGARQLETDFGEVGYGGPCPPQGHGVHRYVFTVYALPVEKLDVKSTDRTAIVGFTISQSALAKASITATYSR